MKAFLKCCKEALFFHKWDKTHVNYGKGWLVWSVLEILCSCLVCIACLLPSTAQSGAVSCGVVLFGESVLPMALITLNFEPFSCVQGNFEENWMRRLASRSWGLNLQKSTNLILLSITHIYAEAKLSFHDAHYHDFWSKIVRFCNNNSFPVPAIYFFSLRKTPYIQSIKC